MHERFSYEFSFKKTENMKLLTKRRISWTNSILKEFSSSYILSDIVNKDETYFSYNETSHLVFFKKIVRVGRIKMLLRGFDLLS